MTTVMRGPPVGEELTWGPDSSGAPAGRVELSYRRSNGPRPVSSTRYKSLDANPFRRLTLLVT